MDEPIFKLSKKRYSGDSSVVSLRMTKDMLSDLDALAKYTGRSRNEVILLSLEFALNHMQVTNEETNE